MIQGDNFRAKKYVLKFISFEKDNKYAYEVINSFCVGEF